MTIKDSLVLAHDLGVSTRTPHQIDKVADIYSELSQDGLSPIEIHLAQFLHNLDGEVCGLTDDNIIDIVIEAFKDTTFALTAIVQVNSSVELSEEPGVSSVFDMSEADEVDEGSGDVVEPQSFEFAYQDLPDLPTLVWKRVRR